MLAIPRFSSTRLGRVFQVTRVCTGVSPASSGIASVTRVDVVIKPYTQSDGARTHSLSLTAGAVVKYHLFKHTENNNVRPRLGNLFHEGSY